MAANQIRNTDGLPRSTEPLLPQVDPRGAIVGITKPRQIGSAPEIRPLLISGKEARRLLGIGPTKYFALLKAGELDTVLLGRRRQVTYASLVRLAEQGSSR